MKGARPANSDAGARCMFDCTLKRLPVSPVPAACAAPVERAQGGTQTQTEILSTIFLFNCVIFIFLSMLSCGVPRFLNGKQTTTLFVQGEALPVRSSCA